MAQLKKLEAEANDSAKSAKNSAISAEALCSAVKRKQSEIEQSNSGHPSSSTHSDDKDDEIIRLRDQELQQQPESTYSFDDWNVRAHAVYASKI